MVEPYAQGTALILESAAHIVALVGNSYFFISYQVLKLSWHGHDGTDGNFGLKYLIIVC